MFRVKISHKCRRIIIVLGAKVRAEFHEIFEGTARELLVLVVIETDRTWFGLIYFCGDVPDDEDGATACHKVNVLAGHL